MNKMINKEYNAPKTTSFSLRERSMMCVSDSKSVSVQSFEEDDDLIW